MTTRGVKSSLEVVRQLWAQAGLPVRVLERTVRAGHVVLAHDPSVEGQAVRGSFQITAVAQGVTAAIALVHRFYVALQAVEAQRRSTAQVVDDMVLDRVAVDARHALAEYKGWTRLYTGPPSSAAEMLSGSISTDSNTAKSALNIDAHAVADWDPLAGLYRAKPNPDRTVPGIVRIHTNFPHHKLGILQLLRLAPAHLQWTDEGINDVFARFTKDDVQHEVEKWDAFELEAQAHEMGLCVTAYRSEDEWSESEMGRAVRAWMDEVGGSAFRITRIPCSTRTAQGEGSQSSYTNSSRDGGRMKVIDMSRVIAGPISTRTLAALGADVLLISSPHLPNLPLRELETARGKRTAFATLSTSPALSAELKELIRGADVFSQAYRPQGLSGRGLGANDVQALRPGIVYAELCAFGFTGPWANRRAYDSLTQTACGMNWLESLSHRDYASGKGAGGGEGVGPRAMPVQALDYAAGSLMCFATLACRCRAILERMGGEAMRVEEGWRVQVSLASTAEWIKGLGQIHGEEAWERPPKDVLPSVEEGLLDMVSSYKVRGLKRSASDDREAQVRVLAIRHASVPAAQDEKREDLQWTVPAHLGVDELRW